MILDSDVAELYGVQTKRVNEAVSNNPEKFPEGYIVELSDSEKNELVEIFHQFNKQKHSTVVPRIVETCHGASLQLLHRKHEIGLRVRLVLQGEMPPFAVEGLETVAQHRLPQDHTVAELLGGDGAAGR